MNKALVHALAASFRSFYPSAPEPLLFKAPGRVNLIGEHTDYNDGFVLPAAIDLATYIAAAAREDRRLNVRSLQFDNDFSCDLGVTEPPRAKDWTDYVQGVALVLHGAGFPIRGTDLLIDSDLPMGAGLSASAALEVGVGLALATVSGATIGATELALLCQRAENEFVGARCGIMDQFVSCHGIAGSALLLDCRSLTARPVTIARSARLLIADTMVRHQIATGDYNQRRRECEEAVTRLSAALPRLTKLRDLSEENLIEHAALLPPELLRRARHVVTENARTLRAAQALDAGDLAECGRLMSASHKSLKDDYQVSCSELDIMVAAAQRLPGVYGARMMGGGFGGCSINLVAATEAEQIMDRLAASYAEATGVAPKIFCCVPGAGAGPVVL
jgi:galactokinase